MATNLTLPLRAGYEQGDGTMDGAQLVDGEWWHPTSGCDSLQEVVDAFRTRGELPDNYIDPEHRDGDKEMLTVFYAACLAEGGTADEVTLRGLRAVVRWWGTTRSP